MEDRETKDEQVLIRVSKAEKQEWLHEAGKKHMKLAEFIRFLFAKYKG